MIAKNKIGRSFKGVTNYLMSKVENGQGSVLETRHVRENRSEMIADFNMSRHYNPNLSRCVWHTSLSFDKQDKLTDEKMLEISKEWMKGMGLHDTAWVVISHSDTDHKHVHIVCDRVADNGITISDSNNYKRSEAICRELEIRYGLAQVPEIRNGVNQSALKGRDLFKEQCYRSLRDALKQSRSIDEFNKKMKAKDIDCVWRHNPDGTVRGLTFEKKNIKLKASDVHRSFSAKRIASYLENNQKRSARKAIKATKSASDHFKEAGYHFADALDASNSPEDDIIQIDKIINPVFKPIIRYGR